MPTPSPIRCRCSDCDRKYVHGVTGEARESGGRCLKCLREVFGADYKISARELDRAVAAHRLEKRVARYGLTRDGHAALAVTQNNACAICGFAPPDRDELVIDHNHVTGTVRGLLCGKCNTGLGLFGDDPDRLDAAARYLKERGSYG